MIYTSVAEQIRLCCDPENRTQIAESGSTTGVVDSFLPDVFVTQPETRLNGSVPQGVVGISYRMDVTQNISGEDPRITGEYLRQVDQNSESFVLVGVVHDHPASTHRVQTVARTVDPAMLALELPPVALPLFEARAKEQRRPTAAGCEMSAAIQASEAEQTIGIDHPTLGFYRKLLGNFLRQRPSLDTVRPLVTSMLSKTRRAVRCRTAATLDTTTSVRIEVDVPVAHDTDRSDAPAVQARDEQRRIQQSRSFRSAVSADEKSRAARFEDETREQYMAERLREQQTEGPTVAVVGIDHLDPLAELLGRRGHGAK
jgi:hypothetical protein